MRTIAVFNPVSKDLNIYVKFSRYKPFFTRWFRPSNHIIFCKVFDDQRKKYGLTQKAVEETIRICKDRNILKNYLESKEKEVVTIMMSLFDEEQIMKIYVKDKQKETAKDAARSLFKKGVSFDIIADSFSLLSIEELKEIEAEVLALA